MNKPINERFIELSSLEDISKWAEGRKFDVDLLKSLYIGKATLEVLQNLQMEFSKEELIKNGFTTKTCGFKYANRIIIPYTRDYFAARSIHKGDKYKNLYPKGKEKQPFFIKGQDNQCFICEGETDAIRLKHVFPDSNMFSLGGVMGFNLLKKLPKLFSGNKLIIAYDNDKYGQECFEKSLSILELLGKNYDIYKLKFDEKFKDIDDYFFNEQPKEDLQYIQVSQKSIYEPKEDVSIYSIQDLLNKPIPEIEYLDSGELIPKQGIATFGGSQAAGKSMVAMHLSMAVSIGKQFLNEFQTKKSNVLYVNEEMNLPITINRFNQLRIGNGWLKEDFSNLYLSHLNNLKLDTNAKQKWFMQQLDKYKPGLVVLDSAVRMMTGDENSSKDVRKVFDFIKPIIKEREICFLILHHLTKGNNRNIDSLRGSGDFAAAPDVVVMFNKNGQFVNCDVQKHRNKDQYKFSIQFENTIEKNLRLKYVEQNPDEKTAIQQCADDLEEWLQDKNIVNFRSKDAINAMKSFPHSRQTIYEALKLLKKDKVIIRQKRGLWQCITTGVIDDKTINDY